MSAVKIDTSVIIAGGGPVGMILALELARRGVACVLLNDKPTTATHPKANAISSRTMEHLRRLGIAEAVRARGLDPDHPTDVSYFTRLTEHEIGRFRQPSRAEAVSLAEAGEGAWASPEPPHRCSQLYLEAEIKRAVDAEPTIDVRFGWRLDSFEDDGREVTATASETEGDGTLELRADYLVGCDGASSTVRKALGVELEGESGVVRPMMGGPMYAAYFETETVPDWLPERKAWQYWSINNDVRTCMVHIDSDRQFVILFAVPDEEKREDVDPRPYIYDAIGREFPINVHSTLNWTAGFALVAQQFQKGRVLLAGDAAHLFTPTGGMGMNTGVDDAVNLGWKMAAVLQERGGPNLLESYETERRAIGHRNVQMASRFADSVGSVEITDDLEADNDAGRAERAALTKHFSHHGEFEFRIPGIFLGLRYAESQIITYDGVEAPPDEPNTYVPFAGPGARAPHAWHGGAALYDHFGPEFTLICFGNTQAEAAPFVAAAEAQSLDLSILPLNDEELRQLYGADLILIRPDHHVAWRGDSGDAAAEILNRAMGG